MNTSRTIALANLSAFTMQMAFALLMLHIFSPQEVGDFSAISQIGFFWMTLALAQSNLSLLANQDVPAPLAARQAWRASLLRGLGLIPVAALAVWFTQLLIWPALLWAMLLAFCQLAWMLAQSLTLRKGSLWRQAAVRVLPPATAVACAITAALLGASFAWHEHVLLLAALLGYAVGAAWLLPAFQSHDQQRHENLHLSEPTNNTPQSDARSPTLRMAHTLIDALLATTVIVVWQRLYGPQETGLLSAPLRVLGFVPAVVHMAWAQVILAQNANTRHGTYRSSLWLGLSAFACVGMLGLACAAAVHLGWLAPKWSGVLSYIIPLVVWQGSACMSAAFSYLPFQTQSTRKYSWACMGLAMLQMLVLLGPIYLEMPVNAGQHITAFAIISSLGLLSLSGWMAKSR